MNNFNQNDPVAFFRTAKKAFDVMKEASKKDPERMKLWRDTMYKDRWKNFIWSTIFSGILCTAFYFEMKFSIILGLLGGGIMMLVTAALALLSLYTMYTYAKVIITGKSVL